MEIEMDERAPAWGRPIARKVPLGALLSPVSPLCLYKKEMDRIAETLVKAIKDRGFAGIYVQYVDPLDPANGAIRVVVHLSRISEVRVEDRRVTRKPEADPDSIRKECPLKVGDYLNRPKLDAIRDLLSARLHTDVDISISAQDGQDPGQVVLTILLGPARGK